MPIEITLERRQLQLTSTEAALAKAATSRQALRRRFDQAIALAEPYRIDLSRRQGLLAAQEPQNLVWKDACFERTQW